eukprot:11035839-Alexandrium_andersonii.AAC.1
MEHRDDLEDEVRSEEERVCVRRVRRSDVRPEPESFSPGSSRVARIDGVLKRLEGVLQPRGVAGD